MKKENNYDPKKHLFDLIDTSGIIGVVIDQHCKILYINEGAEKISGYTKDEVIGKNCIETFVPKGHRKKILAYVTQSFLGNIPKTVTPIITKSGEERMVCWNGGIKKNPNGKYVLAAYGQDITKEIKAKKTLERKEKLYKQLVENSFALIYTKDLQGKYLSINPTWKMFKGLDRNRAIGKTDHEIFGEKIAKRFHQTDKITIKTKKIQSFQDEFVVNGEKHYQSTVKYPLRDIKGKIIGICGISHDITDKVKAEKEIKIFERIFEQSSEGMAIASLDGIIIDLNSSWARMHGYRSKKNLVGKHLKIFHTKEQLINEVIPFNKKILDVGHRAGQIGHVKKNGKEFQTFMTTSILKNEQGKPYAMIGVARDITKEKRMERELKEKEEKYRTLTETVPSGLFICDQHENIKFANKQLAKMLKYKASQLIGKNLGDLVNKKNYERFKKETLLRLKGISSQYESILIGKDGGEIPILLSAAPLLDKNKKYKSTMNVVTDISALKNAEKALRKNEEKYRTLFDNINIGVYRATPGKHGKFLDVNPALVKILGYESREELLNIRISDIYLNPKERIKITNEVKKSELIKYDEILYKKKDGTPVLTSDGAKTVMDENGKPLYFDGIIEDITEQRKLQKQIKNYAKHLEKMVLTRTQELEDQTKKAIEATKIKTEFLASVSHELRTPLTSIIGYTELMEDEIVSKLDKERENHIKIIKKNANQLLNLISDILDITKIEGNKMKLKIEECNVRKLVMEIKRVFKPLFSKKGLKLEIQIEEGVPRIIKTDHQKLRQILFNLTSNALKFTPQGEVKIRVYMKKKKIIFEVKDTGIGISGKNKGKLFEVFQRTDNPLVQKTDGSGLGLVLTKKMINLLDGKIEVKSKLEEGSSFIASFPLQR